MNKCYVFNIIFLVILWGCSTGDKQKNVVEEKPFEAVQKQVVEFIKDSIYLTENYHHTLADVMYLSDQNKLIVRHPTSEDSTLFMVLKKDTTQQWNDTLIYECFPLITLPNSIEIVKETHSYFGKKTFIKLKTNLNKDDYSYFFGFFDGSVKMIRGAEDIANVDLLSQEDSIWTGYLSYGCADMIMNFKLYQQVHDSVNLFKEITIDLCDTTLQDSCQIKIGKGEYQRIYEKEIYKYLQGVPDKYVYGIYEKMNRLAEISKDHYVDNFPLIFYERQFLLDSLFHEHNSRNNFEYKKISAQLFLGNIFTKNQKHALLRYQNTDTTSLLIVLRNRREKWDTIFHSTIESKGTFGNFSQNEESVQLQDINFDGIQDVLIRKEILPMGSIELYHAFVYQQNQLKEVKKFEEIGTPHFDKKTKEIYTQFISSSQLIFSISKVEKDQLISLQKVQIIPHPENDSTVQVIVNDDNPAWMTWEKTKTYIPEIYRDGY